MDNISHSESDEAVDADDEEEEEEDAEYCKFTFHADMDTGDCFDVKAGAGIGEETGTETGTGTDVVVVTFIGTGVVTLVDIWDDDDDTDCFVLLSTSSSPHVILRRTLITLLSSLLLLLSVLFPFILLLFSLNLNTLNIYVTISNLGYLYLNAYSSLQLPIGSLKYWYRRLV